jgi:hypothetical protein
MLNVSTAAWARFTGSLKGHCNADPPAGAGMLVNWTDILDGAIANAAWGVVSMAAKPRASRRVAVALDTAAWADTERLIRDALADITVGQEMPDLSQDPDTFQDEVAELTATLNRHEVRGALQALLAVRLTDAPETDAAHARGAVRLALTGQAARSPFSADPLPMPAATKDKYAAQLSDYFDTKICALVATLEGRVGFAGLAQVRAEAHNTRIVALLGAIERQVTALADPERGGQAEAEFIDRYRRQAHQRHGFLTPPDFDRRRRVPVADIYVSTEVSRLVSFGEIADQYSADLPDSPHESREQTGDADPEEPDRATVLDLAGQIDRAVLLGDPGGGKTTAANVLTDHFASDRGGRVPFLVTLREYAAKAPIEWSVAEHVEQNLKSVYQSGAPDGLVERLLVTGRAIVIFDGLDELLDTSRRRDVSDRVEQFCSAYPLTPVLVTSRVVGYDQARLDDSQFTRYRLDGFGDDEVAEYARKWFTTQDDLPPAQAVVQADAFLAESANARDLRANPLLLSLMCILYRGAGSLPGDRAGIYARCAELLLRRWDEQRDLYRKLGSDHLVEPTLRYLAWWLFTREDSQTAATERELIAKSAEFLHERGYETQEEARAAAREFVAFCRGRMWVFSDAGTTADGERLYGFTHRTFLEYFAAWHLAAVSDTPEDLARELARRVHASSAWATVGELAVKIKADATDRAADRIYATLLDEAATDESVLWFLAKSTESARPSPGMVRRVTNAVLDEIFRVPPHDADAKLPVSHVKPLEQLFSGSTRDLAVASDVSSNRIATMVASADETTRIDALQLIAELGSHFLNTPLRRWARGQVALYSAEISVLSDRSTSFRLAA